MRIWSFMARISHFSSAMLGWPSHSVTFQIRHAIAYFGSHSALHPAENFQGADRIDSTSATCNDPGIHLSWSYNRVIAKSSIFLSTNRSDGVRPNASFLLAAKCRSYKVITGLQRRHALSQKRTVTEAGMVRYLSNETP